MRRADGIGNGHLPVVAAVGRGAGAAPLVRQSTTFAVPGSTELATIELVVISDALDDGPSWHDLPESREAGWSGWSVGDFVIRVRVIF